jgi:hypothetical protein
VAEELNSLEAFLIGSANIKIITYTCVGMSMYVILLTRKGIEEQ